MAGSRRERKVVTVLFADLVGFTSRAEQLDPEDVEAILAPYHARLRSELERYGGTVEKFIGDAVLAIFGAPVAHEDDPERAVRSALAIRDWAAEEGALEVRIAVNTGEALVSLAARPEAGEGMVSGDVVNTAARLQAAAPVNGILVGETTYRATEHAIEYREAEPVEAKGKAEPVRIWGAVQARARFGVDLLRRPRAPLVGRQRELDVLVDALARVRAERSPQLVTLVGVPGIGKSRLVYELFQAVEADPELIYWRQGRSLPYGEGVSFWALSEMVKSQAGILETDPHEQVEAKLHEAVAHALPDESDVRWVERHLRPLVGLGGEVELGGDRRVEAFAAWRRFFEALAEQRPLVLVFEDLQWADEGLLDFVDHLVDWASGVPILVACMARPELLERRPGWGGGKRNATTVSLSPLSEKETARLIGELLDRPLLPAETQSELLQRAGGNPLYAEEYVRMLGDRGPGDLSVPETLQGIVAARLDALRPEEKGLLQDAAVLGKVFWLGALQAKDGAARWQLEERLHALERKEFVRRERRSSVEGDSEYAFLHVLVRDVAYGQIPRAQRAEKHRLAAEWIESLGRAEDTAEMLAHHYLSALEYARAAAQEASAIAERARGALRDAGDRAFALSAFPAAGRYYSAALELWPGDDPARPYLLFRCGAALVPSDRGLELLIEARDLLFTAGDVETAAEAEARIAETVWLQGRRDDAYEHAERAVDLVEAARPSPAKAYVLGSRARFHMLADESEDAIRTGREALAMAELLVLKELEAGILVTVGTARANEGDEGGIADLERSVAIATERSAPQQIHRGYNNLAMVHVGLGRLDDAAEAYAAARRWNERFGFESGLRWLLVEDAWLAYTRGDWNAAQRLTDEFIEGVEPGSSHYLESPCRIIRSHLALARDDVDAALTESARMVEAAREAKDAQVLVPALACRARMLLAVGRVGEARGLAAELLERGRAGGRIVPGMAQDTWIEVAWALRDLGFATEVVADLERRPAETWARAARAIANGEPAAAEVLGEIGARTHEAYARLRAADRLVTAGRRAEADEQLQRALAFYRSVGATRYLREGEALLAASA